MSDTMNGFERMIVQYYGDGPDAVASCPAGHEIGECHVEQDDTSERWWVAAPTGTPKDWEWTNENSIWEFFAEQGVFVWSHCDQTDRHAWIDPSTRTPYQGEVRGLCIVSKPGFRLND